ncbi:A24 family peptidase [Virgisporangium ochraceum]
MPSLLLITPLLRAAVAIHAVPAGTPWRRCCDSCGDPLSSRVFYPAGRCGFCRARIGAPPFWLEAVTAVAIADIGALVAAGRLSLLESLAVAWWVGWAIPLAFIDAAVHRLPDRLTYPAAAGTVALLGLAAALGPHGAGQFALAVVAGLGIAGAFAILTLTLGRLGPGLGDAKLLLSTATLLGWFGWQALAVGIALGLVAQGLVAAVVLAGRSEQITHVPMGPFLIGGAAVAVTVAS